MSCRSGFFGLAVLCLSALAVVSTVRMARADSKTPTFKEEPVFRLVSTQDRKMLTMSSPAGSMTVADPNTLVTVLPVGGTTPQAHVLVTKDSSKFLNDLKPGDYLTLTTEVKMNISYVKSLKRYDLRPGEDVDGVFLFVGTGEAVKAGQTLNLFKLGKAGVALVPTDKAALQAIAARLKVGDAIEVAGSPTGGGLVLSELWLYCPPTTGTIAALSEESVGDAKTPALKLTTAAGDKTLCVPGKTNDKGVFTPDLTLAAKIKACKVGDAVQALFHSDGQTLWLKAVAPAPKAK